MSEIGYNIHVRNHTYGDDTMHYLKTEQYTYLAGEINALLKQ